MSKAGRAADPLILDTHVWIWVLEGTKGELSAATIRRIESAAADSALAVSALSVWEVAMLEKKGRITLSRSIEEWTKAALTAPGIRLVDLTPEIALESTRLPGGPHGDPADRIIIATARVLGGTLVTRDKQILEYAKTGHVRARDARKRS
jgi:PIN domain nuclease of toxin-antitoxin system